MEWITAFIQDFDGPAWTTLGVSVIAVAVSVIALSRTRTLRPHWELVGVEESEHSGNSPLYVRETDGGIFPGDRYWSVRIRQSGPGTAESVVTQVRRPNGNWWVEQREDEIEVRRGSEIERYLCDGLKESGEYLIRVRYRRLPNTRKLRTWQCSFTLD